MLENNEPPFTAPPEINQGWIVTFSDLVSLLLAFFVVLYSVSTREPSKVDAAVSSVSDRFAKSSVNSEFGTVASQSGVVIHDQEYLDSVVSALRGRDTRGEVIQLRSNGGTLIVRLARDKVFIPRTGVLSPEGVSLTDDIARVMAQGDAAAALPSMEVRMIATAEELAAGRDEKTGELPVFMRQASSFARATAGRDTAAQAISAVLLEGGEAMLELAFYTIAPAGANPPARTRAP